MSSLSPIYPELLLAAVACVLFLLGIATGPGSRKLAAQLALWTLAAATVLQVIGYHQQDPTQTANLASAVRLDAFAHYAKILITTVGFLLVLLNMPTNEGGTGGTASEFGSDTAEFFGLMLLSLAGLLTVASANDLILLFLGIELASIPTYIMVSISRPLPVAQEAGVKYFFLGAMAAAVMLFGFSYLYGMTGLTRVDQIAGAFSAINHGEWAPVGGAALGDWTLLAVLMLIGGLTFKMAAVPLHAYAGDVYQGAATPVTAFLSFVPKTSGFLALIKILYAVSGGAWLMPETVVKVLAVLAALTMTVGNVLGLMQFNLKRVLAYSSVAHSGYMLAGVAALVGTADAVTQSQALQGVLFYLAAYGITSVGAFGVLMLIPARHDHPATSAETFEDLAGQAHKNPGLGLAFAVACLSLTGLPLTVGFFAKLYLVKPALGAGLTWLVAILVLNAAISAVYYLRMIAAMYLRPEPGLGHQHPGPFPAQPFAARLLHPAPVRVAVLVSALASVLFGVYVPALNALTQRARQAAVMTAPQLPALPNATMTASTAQP